jgi:hypothetical protein
MLRKRQRWGGCTRRRLLLWLLVGCDWRERGKSLNLWSERDQDASLLRWWLVNGMVIRRDGSSPRIGSIREVVEMLRGRL